MSRAAPKLEGVAGARPVFLDHHATSPLDPDVWAAMVPYFLDKFGNPSSVEHVFGAEAAEGVDHAREQVARLIGARASEILFTGSCTEASNIAILGLARSEPTRRHFITSAIEHPAVLETFAALQREGHAVTILPVDDTGLISLDDLAAAITTNTALVSVMAANNEVGTLQPLAAIGELCAKRNVLFHSDLAQTAAHIAVDVEACGIHLASLSGHKAYGPKGVGALYLRSRRPRPRPTPVIFGGGQERGLRSGTLNTPAIVGMGAAFEKVLQVRDADRQRLRSMTNEFRDHLLAAFPEARCNGHQTHRLPNSLSFSIPGVEPLALMRVLRNSVCFSASSACSTEEMKTSHVLLAMHGEGWRARNAFRLAPGRFTTLAEWQFAGDRLIDAAKQLHRAVA